LLLLVLVLVLLLLLLLHCMHDGGMRVRTYISHKHVRSLAILGSNYTARICVVRTKTARPLQLVAIEDRVSKLQWSFLTSRTS
jgi:hypothetical protein